MSGKLRSLFAGRSGARVFRAFFWNGAFQQAQAISHEPCPGDFELIAGMPFLSWLVADGSPTPEWEPGLGRSCTSMLGSGSFVAAFCGNRLSNLAYEEWLKIGLIASPFKAGNRMPWLTRNEVSLSVGASYFELAGLALQGLGNVIGSN